MTVTAPPRPPRPSDPVTHGEFDALVEALIEEARRRGRRRRRRNGAIVTLVALVGASLFALLGRSAQSQDASSALSARSGLAAAAGQRIAFTQGRFGGQFHGALYVVNADGSGKRKLAPAARGTPSWSPDGRKIAFGGAVVNADGSGLQVLARRHTSPAWSPDGRKIAYTGVYVVNADGSGERIVGQGGGWYPRWSPDGRMIAFVRREAGPGRFNFDIYVVNARGGPARNLTRTPAYEVDPAWSPDGRSIAFARGGDIWLMNADGSGQRRLTSGAARDRVPAWSPDGRTIAFDRGVGRRPTNYIHAARHEIHVMNADGSGQRGLARNGAAPLWSSDGKKIAFSRPLGNGLGGPTSSLDNWEIFVMNADGTKQRNVTRNRHWDDCCVAWSPAQR